MALFSLVAAHTNLDLETVARLSTGTDEVFVNVPQSPAMHGAVVLSTCNRLEIYVEAVHEQSIEAARDEIVEAIARGADLPIDDVKSSFKTLPQKSTVSHLFRVGSGLDSAVVGEREIAGQVRRALTFAREAGIATGTLTKLFEHATRTAKDVGTQTALGSTGRSIVSVALDLASDMRAGTSDIAIRRFWEDANVLVVGTGAYAGATLSQLEQRGAKNVAVHSSSGRAEQFVADRGGWAIALGGNKIQGAFAEADVLIGCSGGSRVLEAETLARLRSDNPQRLTVLDLALTHDFDPAIAELPGVDLITLESVKMAAPEEQHTTLARAQQLVEEAVDSYVSQQRARDANDAIVALRRHTHEVLEEEIERVRARHGCTAAAEEVELAMRRMVRQLLHTPTIRAREMATDGRLEDYEQALDTLFGLKVTSQRPASQNPGVIEKTTADDEEFCPADQASSQITDIKSA